MTSTIRHKAAALAACALCLGLPAGSQNKPPRQEPFFDAVSVKVINIEVIVTDKEDNPVTGPVLSGRPQPIPSLNDFSAGSGI